MGIVSKSKTNLALFAVCWGYLVEGVIIGNWSALIPSVKAQLGVNNAEFGDILFAAGGGAMLCIPLAPFMRKWFGSGTATVLGGLLLCGTMIIMGSVRSLPVFGFATVFYGLAVVFMDAVVNCHCALVDEVCKQAQRDDPSKVAFSPFGVMHACFAVGAMVGALVSGGLLSVGYSAITESAVVCGAFGVSVLLTTPLFYTYSEENAIQAAAQAQELLELEMEAKEDSGAVMPFDSAEVVEGTTAETEVAQSRRPRNKRHISLRMDLPWDMRMTATLTVIMLVGCFGAGTSSDWSALYLQGTWPSLSPLYDTFGYGDIVTVTGTRSGSGK